MTNQIFSCQCIPLELVRLTGPVGDVFTSYSERVAAGTLPKAALNKREFCRLSVVFDRLTGFDTLLDIGTGMAQLATAARASGQFLRVVAADAKLHSSVQNLEDLETVEINLTGIPDPNLRADVVVCQGSILAQRGQTGLAAAIQNLSFLARQRLIVIVPYNESPLPKGRVQSFSISRLMALFPAGRITLLSEAATIPWAMIEVDMV